MTYMHTMIKTYMYTNAYIHTHIRRPTHMYVQTYNLHACIRMYNIVYMCRAYIRSLYVILCSVDEGRMTVGLLVLISLSPAGF